MSTVPLHGRSPVVLLVALLALGGSALPAAAGTVEVNWLHPDQYSDAGRSFADRERTMKSLTDYFTQLGRRLPDGQTLKLEVLDVDLAGGVEPWGWDELRVLRGRADWPRMTLRFSLQAGGQTLKAGEERLSDMNYMFARPGLDMQGGDLVYEKRMLSEWFVRTFAAD